MEHTITASWETLMRQAGMTSDEYFNHALSTLTNSGLKFTTSDVINLASISERDFRNSSQFIAFQRICEAVSEVSHNVVNLVDTLEMIREANNQ